MAKRFIDTDIFKKSWFAELHADQQQLWFYICTQCDAAGFWEKNYRLASFELKRQIDDVSFNCFGERVVHFEGDKLWIKGFVEFQYGELSESCKPHKGVISLLRKRGIDPFSLTLSKGYGTLQDKTRQDKDKNNSSCSAENTDQCNSAPAEPVESTELERAVAQFQKTLEHFKAGRTPVQAEKEEIWKMLKGGIPLEELVHAISGMRYEPATTTFSPAKHISVFRLWDREKRIKLMTLSTQEMQRRAAKQGGAA